MIDDEAEFLVHLGTAEKLLRMPKIKKEFINCIKPFASKSIIEKWIDERDEKDISGFNNAKRRFVKGMSAISDIKHISLIPIYKQIIESAGLEFESQGFAHGMSGSYKVILEERYRHIENNISDFVISFFETPELFMFKMNYLRGEPQLCTGLVMIRDETMFLVANTRYITLFGRFPAEPSKSDAFEGDMIFRCDQGNNDPDIACGKLFIIDSKVPPAEMSLLEKRSREKLG
ncbi:hypothetical protein ACO2RV_19080 [Ancylobacter sp. VNQ12]|uniref:hypothetical protein n=1 Tax=Ancylobacter sp. VNQ12 TaxID=3400920 RepID=UPI003BFDEF4A